MKGAEVKIAQHWNEPRQFYEVKQASCTLIRWWRPLLNHLDMVWHLLFFARVVRRIGPGISPSEKSEIENLKARFHRFGGGFY